MSEANNPQVPAADVATACVASLPPTVVAIMLENLKAMIESSNDEKLAATVQVFEQAFVSWYGYSVYDPFPVLQLHGAH